MGLQNKVGLYPAIAVQGDKATASQSVYTPTNLFAEGDVTIGSFVFEGSDPETQASATSAADAKPIGFVERVINYFNYDVRSEASMTVTDGTPLTIAVKGDYFMKSPSLSVVGQKIFVKPTDGSVMTSGEGMDNEGFVETSWTVKTNGFEGDIIKISNWETN